VHILYLTAGADQLPDYRPGQYVTVGFSDGLERPLSIASAPGGEHLEFHIRHLPGSEFTARLIEGVGTGDSLSVSAAKGRAWLRDDGDRPISLVAGGTGLAPALAMITHLSQRGDSRPLRLFWGARGPDDLYASERLEVLKQRHCKFNWQPVVMEPGDHWKGVTGLVHEIALSALEDIFLHDIYLSGPPAMLRAANESFRAAGAHPERLFYDLE